MTAAPLVVLAESRGSGRGAVLMPHSRIAVRGIGAKSSATDPVSDADREAERTIVDAIHAARSMDAIVGQEGTAVRGTSGVRWLVDPLDGTANFLYRCPQWSVSVACVDDESAIAGPRPSTTPSERGVRGDVRRRSVPGRASACADHGYGSGWRARAHRIFLRRRGARVPGPTGRLDDRSRPRHPTGGLRRSGPGLGRGRTHRAYVELFVNPWEWASGALLVREAGGRVSPVPGVRPGVPGIGTRLHEALVGLLDAPGR